MRIMLLSDEFPPEGTGGDAAVVANLANGYQKNGHEVFVIAPAYKREMVGRAKWQGILVERIYSKFHPRVWAWLALWRPVVTKKIRASLKEFKPDIVHAHALHGYLSFYSLVLARKSGARVFMTVHDAMTFALGKVHNESQVREVDVLRRVRYRYNPFYRFFVRHVFLKQLSGLIAVSHSLARAMKASGINSTAVVHNGINVQEWKIGAEALAAFRVEHGLGENVILFGGRLSKLKGGIVALEALREVVKVVPSTQLCVMGNNNPTAESMLELARSWGIENNLVFTGRLAGEALCAAYHASQIVLVPSLYVDPLPTITLEAHACKKPVIATSYGGASEIVEDGLTGYVIDPGDISIFSAKIVELLTDRLKREKFGETGYERVTRNFTMEKQVHEYEEFFRKALNQK